MSERHFRRMRRWIVFAAMAIAGNAVADTCPPLRVKVPEKLDLTSKHDV